MEHCPVCGRVQVEACYPCQQPYTIPVVRRAEPPEVERVKAAIYRRATRRSLP